MFRLSPHCQKQIALKELDEATVLRAANSPQLTYDNGRYPGQKRHIGYGICAVVDPARGVVVTVYLNTIETDIRKDQLRGKNSRDARRYAAQRSV